jgi:hypothetical protein
MILAKVLEKKEVIRGFGVALILAPFVNTLVKMSMIINLPNPWSWAVFWKVLQSGAVVNQALYVATFLIGLMMLQGRRSVWKFVLVLLGGYNLQMIFEFRTVNYTAVTWVFFIVNVAAFLFVADQLVWKIEVPEKKAKAPTPQPNPQVSPQAQNAAPKPAQRVIPKVRKKILFQFDDSGPWGQLMGVSKEGIHVRGISEPPTGIGYREIEISLAEGVTLRTRLASRNEKDYFFDHKSLTKEEIQSLNKWLHSLSEAA